MDKNSQGVVKLDDGSKLTIVYSKKYDVMVFEAKVERGSFLAMGFGQNMMNTEIAAWHAYEDGHWKFDTWWATGHHDPAPAPQFASCYYSSLKENPNDDRIIIYTTRYLECDVEN